METRERMGLPFPIRSQADPMGTNILLSLFQPPPQCLYRQDGPRGETARNEESTCWTRASHGTPCVALRLFFFFCLSDIKIGFGHVPFFPMMKLQQRATELVLFSDGGWEKEKAGQDKTR